MRIEYLGDAADHTKGSLHAHLRERKLLRNLHVVPMFTTEWPSAAIDAYARLLHLVDSRAVFLPVLRGRAPARAVYFRSANDAVPADADILFDPDTGLRPDPTTSSRHLGVDEIKAFLRSRPNCLATIYDESHDRRIDKGLHIKRLQTRLGAQVGPTLGYNAGRGLTVFFTSRSLSRVRDVGQALRRFLGSTPLRVHGP